MLLKELFCFAMFFCKISSFENCLKNPLLSNIRTEHEHPFVLQKSILLPDSAENKGRAMLTSMEIHNDGSNYGKDNIVVVDSVKDEMSNETLPLYHAIVIRFRQRVQQTYELLFKDVVNFKVTEHVVKVKKKRGRSGRIGTCSVKHKCSTGTGFMCFCCDERNLTKSNCTPRNDGHHFSQHCLNYSKIWLNVYAVGKPVASHFVYLKFYQIFHLSSGQMEAYDVTKGHALRVNSTSPSAYYEHVPISVKFEEIKDEPFNFVLDERNIRVLGPSAKSRVKSPITSPEEYLVVHKESINTDGNECNVAGVGYKAFERQPLRCCSAVGSCLDNQPCDWWLHDINATLAGAKGKYLLKNYAEISGNGVSTTKTGKFLHLKYFSSSHIKISIQMDPGLVMYRNQTAILTQIYTESQCQNVSKVTVVVMNSATYSFIYGVLICNCSKTNLTIRSENAEISPGHMHAFVLQLNVATNRRKYCSARVVGENGAFLAHRRFVMFDRDVCMCVWHCKCACHSQSPQGMGCRPLKAYYYNLAGFLGSPPINTMEIIEDRMSGKEMYFFLIIYLMLFLGLSKAWIGFLFLPPVAQWGLNTLAGMDPSKQRTCKVKLCEFAWNVIFFFSYPVMLTFKIFLLLCCPYYENQDSEENIVRKSTKMRFTEVLSNQSLAKHSSSESSD